MGTIMIWKYGSVGGAWLAFIAIFGVWDAATTAVMTGIALGIGTVVVVLWPQLTGAGVKSEGIRRDAAVEGATRYLREECERQQADNERLRTECRAEIERLRGQFEVLERDLRLENQRIEGRLRLAETRAARFRVMWEMATGKAPSSQDDVEVVPPIVPLIPVVVVEPPKVLPP